MTPARCAVSARVVVSGGSRCGYGQRWRGCGCTRFILHLHSAAFRHCRLVEEFVDKCHAKGYEESVECETVQAGYYHGR